MVEIYTLPTCGICHMVKTKLNNKHIDFQEFNLEDYVNVLHTDHAPVLKINNEVILTSPNEIVNWINKQ